jgi:sortase A
LGGAVSRKRGSLSTIAIVLVGLVGVGMLLYPTVSDWWNTMHQSYAIAGYEHVVAEMDVGEQDRMIAEADAYNAELARGGQRWYLDEEQTTEYEALLNVTDTGIMGYVDIPKIDVTLPIYHGTSDAVLSVAIGHLAGTSLPVGGRGTHCCVSGHRGLPSARLFTDLDLLDEGDLFTFTVLDREATYEVDQIRIVQPDELDDLAIDPKRDYATLVTCTPYGINSERLLVRGHRIDDAPGAYTVLADAVQIRPHLVASVLGVPVVAMLLVWVMVATSRRESHRRVHEQMVGELRKRRVERESINGSSGEEDEHED